MLVLLFQIQDARFAIPARDLVEVLPLVKLDLIAGSGSHVRGLCRHRGTSVVILDLARYLGHEGARREISTRIVIVGAGEGAARLGFLAERATETQVCEENDFLPSPASLARLPFVTKIRQTSEGTLHLLTGESLARVFNAEFPATLPASLAA